MSANQGAMPTMIVSGVTMNAACRSRGTSLLKVAMRAPSDQEKRGRRATWRRRTASWWRSGAMSPAARAVRKPELLIVGVGFAHRAGGRPTSITTVEDKWNRADPSPALRASWKT